MSAPGKEHPRIIGGYAVLRFLGEGGAGQVYACRDEALDRDVAVKILRPSVAQDKTRRDRFLREGRMMARIQSSHVASIFAVGEHDGVPFLVMELLEGQDLESRLKTSGPISVGEALLIARQACLGLDAASRLDVIHRDVKPANIVVTPAGAKLTDFGLARPQDGSASVTTEGLVTGTPAFLAPERAMGKGDDLRSDIYSLGASLYTLIAGRPPFVRETPIEVITAQLKDEPPPLDEVAPEASREVAALVKKMMTKEPKARFQTYPEVIDAVDRCLMQLGEEMTTVNDPFAGPTEQSTSGVGPAVGAPTGVMGSLKQMGLPEIVQMLDIGRKTAGVDIEPTDGERGELSALDGQIVFARRGALEGPDAFFALAGVKEGAFRIRYGREPLGKNIETPTQFLLLEAMRRIDEGGPAAPAAKEPPAGADLDDADTSPHGQPLRSSPAPVSALGDPEPERRRVPVSPNAATVRTFLPPDADIGALAALEGGLPPPIEGEDDPLAPQDTLIVKDERPEDEPAARPEATRARPDPAVLFDPTEPPTSGELDDKTELMPVAGRAAEDRFDSLDGPTVEHPHPDVTASADESSDDDVELTGTTTAAGRRPPLRVGKAGVGAAASFDDDTLPLAQPALSSSMGRLLSSSPKLERFDAWVAGAARTLADKVRERPLVAAATVGSTLLLLLILLAAVAIGTSGGDPAARIAAGEEAEVLAELDVIPQDERTGQQEMYRAQALIALGRPSDALLAVRTARERGADDDKVLRWLVDRLDQKSAGVEIDLLIGWPGETVTALLVGQTEREAYAPRRHAVTALVERGERDRYDLLGVALKDLRDAPSCAERRAALSTIREQAKGADPDRAKAARDAVEAAAKVADNQCMLPMFKEMLPHRFQ